MNYYFFIVSIIFMYISYGCAWKYSHEELRWEIIPESGRLLNNLICLLAFILPVISLCQISSLSWYWLLLINIVSVLTLSHLMAPIYYWIFGCRTPLQYDYFKEKMMKSRLYGADMLITMSIGLILFILAFLI